MFTRIQKVLGAYTIATLFTFPVGYLSTQVLIRMWPNTPDWTFWTGTIWVAFIGWPSMEWARQNLARTLGVKQPITVQGIGARGVPILGDVVRLVGVTRKPPAPEQLHIANHIVLRQGVYRVQEQELSNFLHICWNRQRAGLAPFSRTYWVDKRPFRMRRQKYNVVMEVLGAHELVEGRTQGGSGYLVTRPQAVLGFLRHEYG